MILANKQIGETPLELIQRLRREGTLNDGKVTYAGRLDPMAEGLMIILTSDEVHEKDKYLALDKTYRTQFLFGITTDTYDSLGMITSANFRKINHDKLKDAFLGVRGKHSLPYPPYSSRTVQGKPLWQWAREGQLDQIEIPKRQMDVKEITINSLHEEPINNIIESIVSNIKRVKGDFRQEEIIDQWLSHKNPNQNVTIVTLTISCSSGTYIRSLAHLLGRRIGTGAIALNIKRTKIANYSL